jgi:hypothetical protein
MMQIKQIFIPKLKEDNFQIDFNRFFDSIKEIIVIVASVVTVLLFYLKFRPKARCISSSSFIDFSEQVVVEEKDFEIYWGWSIFGRKMKLLRISRNSKTKLSCKPITSCKQDLQPDCYEQISKGRHTLIKLTQKRHFKDNEVTKVYLEVITPIDDDFKSKINHEINANKIIIKNYNLEEIRNYLIILPPSIDISKIPTLFAHISNLDMPKDQSKGITIFVNVPPKQGNNPGTRIVPIS